MNKTRVIKKYPNRRLYDTEVSKYVTLGEIKQLVLTHSDFQVIDTQSEADITNSILLQIINELENQSMPIFTKDILLNMIRYYGNPMQKALSQFIEKSVRLFATSQKPFQQQAHHSTPSDPHEVMAQLAKQNITAWQTLFENFFTETTAKKTDKQKKNVGLFDAGIICIVALERIVESELI